MEKQALSSLCSNTALASILGLLGTSAMAQEPVPATVSEPLSEAPAVEGKSGGLNVVVVTAERRSVPTQKTAQAISAVTADTLAKNGVFNASGLAQLVPGVDVNQGGGFSQIRVRGVGGGVVNNFGEPGVAYNIGGVYVAQPYGGNAAYHDLMRVEVLKGPQGTLYGRNATAGAINILPNRPSLTGMDAEVTVQLGNYKHREISGMLNIPLGDTVAARFAISKLKHDAYFSNGQSDGDVTSARAQLLFKPNRDMSLLVFADNFSERGRGPGDTPLFPGQNFNGAGAIQPGATGRYLDSSNPWNNLGPDFKYSTGFPAPNNQFSPYAASSIDHKQHIISADLQMDLGFATLNVVPAYVGTKANDHLANYGYNSDVFTDAKQKTLEARLASNGTGPLQWVGGLYYFDQDNNSTQSFFQRGLGYITLGTPKLDSTSYALFGQSTYQFTKQFRLTTGLRFTKEDKSVSGATVAPGVPAFLCPNFIPATGSGYAVTDRCSVTNTGELSFRATNWKLGAEYDLAKDSLLYASASTGFRAGGFNPGAPPNTFAPEKLTAYEVGSKNEFLDRRLRINVSAFYWKYAVESNPVLGPIHPVGLAFIVTPASSHLSGIEFQSAAKLTPDDTVTFNALYQRSAYDKYATLAIPFIGLPATVYDGTTRSNSPTWSGNASYEHLFTLPGGGSLVANASMHFESSSILALASPSPIGYTRGQFATGNLSLTYRTADDKYTVAAFVRNVGDKFVPTSVLQSTSTGNVFQQAQPPRTYGVSLTANF